MSVASNEEAEMAEPPTVLLLLTLLMGSGIRWQLQHWL